MQYFKGDATELKYYNAGKEIADNLSLQKDTFFDEAYGCFVLGELLWDLDLSPLSRAMRRDIFRESFESIFDAFVVAGSFYSYITVFKKVFGDDVEINFTVPEPGKLEIEIIAAGTASFDFVARFLVDNEYTFETIIDDEGDTIVFQTIKGLESQYELEQMLFELVPAGIYTEISLTVG